MGFSIGRSAPRVGFVGGVVRQDGQAVTKRVRNGHRSLRVATITITSVDNCQIVTMPTAFPATAVTDDGGTFR
jgi:hypothetical protein